MAINLAKDCEKIAISKKKIAPVFSTEEQEKEAYQQTPEETLRTRYMFYDMIQWRDKML